MVPEFKLRMGLCTDGVEPAWDSLSLSAPPPLTLRRPPAPALSLSLSLKINKLFFLSLFIYFEKDRDGVSRGGAEREGIPSKLHTVSSEPMQGSVL